MQNYIDSKLTINNKEVANRLVIQPMEGCDANADGSPSSLTRRRYLRFAKSGAGIIWFEAIAVCEEGRANPRQLWLKEENAQLFATLIQEIKQVCYENFGYYPIIIMQATHSGRYSKPNGYPQPIIAYHNQVYEVGKQDLPYKIITDDQCDQLIQNYAHSAQLASQVGFDGIDVKCCHGYLFDEFLSAYTRKGKYGGSFENRTRLYLECVDRVKNNISEDMFVTTRLNAYDGFDYPYGFGVDNKNNIDLSETIQLIEILQNKGLQLINITIGNPYLIPSINRPFIGGTEDGKIGVERIVGITEKLQKTFSQLYLVMSALTFLGEDAINYANDCLKNKKCSLVGFGRMAFAYPDFYVDYKQNGTLDKNKVCIKCGNCSKMMRAGGVAGCPIRDKEVYLPLFRQYMGDNK